MLRTFRKLYAMSDNNILIFKQNKANLVRSLHHCNYRELSIYNVLLLSISILYCDLFQEKLVTKETKHYCDGIYRILFWASIPNGFQSCNSR